MLLLGLLVTLWRILCGKNGHDTTVSEFRFASYYQDSMVLQAAPLQSMLWGYGNIGAVVEVSINVYERYSTKVHEGYDGHGVWSVTFKQQKPGSKADISGSHLYDGTLQTYAIQNVLFGDVWVCGGQSNMVFPLAHMFNSTEELKAVSKYPDIRIFTVSQIASSEPLYDLQSIQQSWAVPSAETAQYFSAVCWLYARHLHDALKIPIGLVSSNWGGSAIEVWSSSRALSKCHLNSGVVEPAGPDFGYNDPNRLYVPHNNSVMWNSMIHPLLNMTIKGVIWYQGEANAEYHRDSYNCSFPAMISDWRSSWYEGTGGLTEKVFHFGFVQIGTTVETKTSFPLLRWHQTADFGFAPNSAMPNTFMAVTLDLPDPSSPYGQVHSRHKEEVGQRLSAAGLWYVYHKGKHFHGPLPVSAIAASGGVLLTYPGQRLHVLSANNFEVCCQESSCDVSDLSPEAELEWHSSPIVYHNMGLVMIADGACPGNVKRVRYAWATDPCELEDCAVYNDFGFPSRPFVMDVKWN